MKLLVFAGSTRQKSFNRQLAHATVALAQAEGIATTHLELADFDIPMYNADLEAHATPPDVMRLKEILWSHAGWIICTPEYNASYPALLKNAIDWASSPVLADAAWKDGYRSFRGKVVGVMSASPGSLGGLRSQSHLTPLLFNLHCRVAPTTFGLAHAHDAFDAQNSLKNPAHSDAVRTIVKQVHWAADRLAA